MASVAVEGSWRNSACIMMLSGAYKYSYANTRMSIRKPILQCTTNQKEAEPEILFVKRHSKSGFMANVHVFPGGVLDKADYSPDWMSVFADAKVLTSITSLKSSGLPLYKAIPLHESHIPAEVAFRICAIRELFEEAGILLARHKSEVNSVLDVTPGSFPPSISSLPRRVLEEWRSRVHDDASQFVTMCNEQDCVPDIWSLIEWSNWLTPRNYNRRFDTIFYQCYSNKKPESSPDEQEVTKSRWIAPSEANVLSEKKRLRLAPPQFAEVIKVQRLLHLGGASLTHLFALHQSTWGALFCRKASRILTKGNVIVSVTELDDLTPQNPEDNVTPVQLPRSSELERRGVTLRLSHNLNYEYEIPDFTPEQLREMSVTINRLEYSPDQFTYFDNVEINKYQEFISEFEGISKL